MSHNIENNMLPRKPFRYEVQAQTLKEGKQFCKRKTGMDEYNYNALLFDFGWWFAFRYAPNEGVAKAWVTDKSIGFWSWFQFQWLLHDRASANRLKGLELTINAYKAHKRVHFLSIEIQDEFVNFLNRL